MVVQIRRDLRIKFSHFLQERRILINITTHGQHRDTCTPGDITNCDRGGFMCHKCNRLN